MFDWKKTLNIPYTFLKKPENPHQIESGIIEKWKESHLYLQLVFSRIDAPLFVIHNSPIAVDSGFQPALIFNKILQDILIKSGLMQGNLAAFVPGFNCHTKKIEDEAIHEMNTNWTNPSQMSIRKYCREKADLLSIEMKDIFIRFGIFGDWDNHYTNLDPVYEAAVIKYIQSFVKKNIIVKKSLNPGEEPVWGLDFENPVIKEILINEFKKIYWLSETDKKRLMLSIESLSYIPITGKRQWGIPFPVLYCQNCETPLLREEVIEKIWDRFIAYGSDCWYTREAEDFVPSGITCSNCGGKKFNKGTEIIEEFLDTGASIFVMENYPGHKYPADIYVEQFPSSTSWLSSSIITGIVTNDHSPVLTILTHGDIVTPNGKPIDEKNIADFFTTDSFLKENSADVIRLWVATTGFKENILLDKSLLSNHSNHIAEIRKHWSTMLANLYDYSPEENPIPQETVDIVDREILYKLHLLKKQTLDNYRKMDFTGIGASILNFLNNDWNTFYYPSIIDILHYDSLCSHQRKTFQSIIYKLLVETLLLAAPILVFTTEEIWGSLPTGSSEKSDSLFNHLFPLVEENYLETISPVEKEKLMEFKKKIENEINKAIDKHLLENATEAEAYLELPGPLYDLALKYKDVLHRIFLIPVSKIDISDKEHILIIKSKGIPCPRCGNHTNTQLPSTAGIMNTEINQFQGLCPRCEKVIKESNIDTTKQKEVRIDF